MSSENRPSLAASGFGGRESGIVGRCYEPSVCDRLNSSSPELSLLTRRMRNNNGAVLLFVRTWDLSPSRLQLPLIETRTATPADGVIYGKGTCSEALAPEKKKRTRAHVDLAWNGGIPLARTDAMNFGSLSL